MKRKTGGSCCNSISKGSKGGNTRIKVVFKVFSNKHRSREKDSILTPLFRTKGAKICLIPTKGVGAVCDTRYTICIKADEEIKTACTAGR